MSCGCHKNSLMQLNDDVTKKSPDSSCVFCAHKHVATAKQLYDLETGYRDINKSHAIGQLILAAWHYDKEYHNLALRCRDIWLKIEKQENVSTLLTDLQTTAWSLVLADSDMPD